VSVFKEKHGIWDPMPELTITSPYPDIVDSEVQLSTTSMTNADKFFPNYQPIGKRRGEEECISTYQPDEDQCSEHQRSADQRLSTSTKIC
jgi:hypothetical protein